MINFQGLESTKPWIKKIKCTTKSVLFGSRRSEILRYLIYIVQTARKTCFQTSCETSASEGGSLRFERYKIMLNSRILFLALSFSRGIFNNISNHNNNTGSLPCLLKYDRHCISCFTCIHARFAAGWKSTNVSSHEKNISLFIILHSNSFINYIAS